MRIKIGEMDALLSAAWSQGLQRQPQNYLVAPNAPWEQDDEVVRWLVAMPLHMSRASNAQAATAENGTAIQFEVIPIRAESVYRDENAFLLPPTIQEFFMKLIFAPTICKQLDEIERRHTRQGIEDALEKSTELALATYKQKIPEDPYQLAEWDDALTVCCFVHVGDPLAWRQITGMNPPYSPLTETEYLNAHIPWFDDYTNNFAIPATNPTKTIERIKHARRVRRHSEIRPFMT